MNLNSNPSNSISTKYEKTSFVKIFSFLAGAPVIKLYLRNSLRIFVKMVYSGALMGKLIREKLEAENLVSDTLSETRDLSGDLEDCVLVGGFFHSVCSKAGAREVIHTP